MRESWEAEWATLFKMINAAFPERVKHRIAADIIILTHNNALHEVKLAIPAARWAWI